MELHERLTTTTAPRAGAAREREPFAELKNQRPPAGDRRARPAALQRHDRTRPRCASASSPTIRQHLADGDRHLARRPRAARERDRRRHPRLRPARAPARRRLDHRDHGQRARTRSGSSARGGCTRRPCASTTSRTCAGSSTRSSPRSAAASTSRRRWSTRACPTAAASTRSSRRSRSRARCSRSASSRKKRLDARRHGQPRHALAGAVEFLQRCVERRAQHPHLGRHRHRQDDAAQRALVGDPRATSGSSRSRTRPSSSSTSGTSCGSSRGRRTSRARARSRSASSCATRCACAPTGSSSARSAAPRRSTCSRR